MSVLEAFMPLAAGAATRYAGPERRRYAGGEPLDSGGQSDDASRAQQALSPAVERSLVVDEVQEAVCAAMSGETPLFELMKRRLLLHCARRPEVGPPAAAEVLRLLSIDIVQRHFHACDKRRRLQRQLADLASGLQSPSRA
ncbi:MAG: hypothetical protein JNL93_04195 [Pelomonas sp.]|nr:hypothetical protein [Roseateles sp.]